MRPRTVLLACSSILGMSVAALVFAVPETTACALLGLRGFDSLPDTSLVETRSLLPERKAIMALAAGARARIEARFGTPRAKPWVVFLEDTDAFWPLSLNATGSTAFIANRTCVMLGPKGRDVDVIAHELMHAELADRVGYWRRLVDVPTWFDEGIAMQVDVRPRYDLPLSARSGDTRYVRKLETAQAFFSASVPERVRNYAAAKFEVAQWLSGPGQSDFYRRLERLRNGESFEDFLAD